MIIEHLRRSALAMLAVLVLVSIAARVAKFVLLP